MDTLLVTPLIKILQNLPAELTSILLFIICIITMLILFKLFDANGLYIYNIVAMLAANIQVLKGVNFSFSPEPIALGTIVFSTIYITSDVINEHYGKNMAQQGVWFCFAAQILMTLLMTIAIGYPSLNNNSNSLNVGTEHMLLAEQAIEVLFTPSLRLLLSSLIAFVITQLATIFIFDFFKRLTKKNILWLRSVVSVAFSSVADTLIFSILAWKILAPNPASIRVLFFTYILWSFLTYILAIILSTPIIYISYYFKNTVKLNKQLVYAY